MKCRTALPFFLFFFLPFGKMTALQSFGKDAIYWCSSYEQALMQKKPLFLFFTGSDLWSEKMEKELLEDAFFAQELSDVFAFIKVEENSPLFSKFQPEVTPMVLLLNEEEELITKFGYLSLDPQEYAEYIHHFLEEYIAIQKTLKVTSDPIDLENLFEKARSLGSRVLEEKIFEKGIAQPLGTYFLLEKYAEHQGFDEESVKKRAEIKEEVEHRDPNNVRKSFYRLALMDFQRMVKNTEGKEAVRPLLQYIEMFPEDEERGWKIEMMISQYLFTKGYLNESLFHARACYKKAPLPIRKDIAESIQHIRGEIREEKH